MEPYGSVTFSSMSCVHAKTHVESKRKHCRVFTTAQQHNHRKILTLELCIYPIFKDDCFAKPFVFWAVLSQISTFCKTKQHDCFLRLRGLDYTHVETWEGAWLKGRGGGCKEGTENVSCQSNQAVNHYMTSWRHDVTHRGKNVLTRPLWKAVI